MLILNVEYFIIWKPLCLLFLCLAICAQWVFVLSLKFTVAERVEVVVVIIMNGCHSFSEVAWRLQFVSKGVCVSPDRPGTLSERKVSWPLMSLRLLVRTLIYWCLSGIQRTTAPSPPFSHVPCASTFFQCFTSLLLWTSHMFFHPLHNDRFLSWEI